MLLSEFGFKRDDDRFISQAFSPEGCRLLLSQLARARRKSLILSYLFIFLGAAAIFLGGRQQAMFCFIGALMFFIDSLKADSDLKTVMVVEKIIADYGVQGSVPKEMNEKTSLMPED